MWTEVTAVITAGGQSRRFGADKARAVLAGSTLLERVAGSLSRAGRRILIAPPGKYLLPGWEAVADGRPGQGPLAGLETALKHAGTGWVAFAGVDLPLLTPAYWETLLQARTPDSQSVQAVHPARGPQPLAALYHVSLLPDLTRMLDAGERRLRQAAPPSRTALVSGLSERSFVNVNTPDDLNSLQS
ncbi:molybdenum cofactor guanylyltransferase [Deinococcus fonticola]|uniref:molybdenum cofactor guanylyltransferase n=1 Tax=Deinococcus fonticola TaxID=2528713 RepID=UPI001074D4DD|nr:molybdenum cofactor guanylyltransferase [Deinococcus fonticola]